MTTHQRKTIEVATLKAQANNMLANSVDDMRDGRIAVALFIERVLMDTGNYRGFNHVKGVWDFTQNPPRLAGDETRRAYY